MTMKAKYRCVKVSKNISIMTYLTKMSMENQWGFIPKSHDDVNILWIIWIKNPLFHKIEICENWINGGKYDLGN